MKDSIWTRLWDSWSVNSASVCCYDGTWGLAPLPLALHPRAETTMQTPPDCSLDVCSGVSNRANMAAHLETHSSDEICRAVAESVVILTQCFVFIVFPGASSGDKTLWTPLTAWSSLDLNFMQMMSGQCLSKCNAALPECIAHLLTRTKTTDPVDTTSLNVSSWWMVTDRLFVQSPAKYFILFQSCTDS